MLELKIFFKLLKVKASLIAISLVSGGGVYFFSESVLFAILIGASVFLYRYFMYYGAMHYESKEKIKALNNKNIIYDTLVNPLSSDIATLNLEQGAWIKGLGSVINCFIDRYYIQYSESGLYFYNASIPYLNMFILPWKNIVRITKDAKHIENYDILSKGKSTFELQLIEGEKITLPLDELCIDKLKDKVKA